MGITPQQFAAMQDRVAGRKQKPGPARAADSAQSHSAASRHTVILGIDPSLRGTGYGVIALGKSNHSALDHGTVKCPATWERSRCLLKIAETLRDVIQEHKPTACAIEGLFFAHNLQTALTMGEARGAAIVAAAGGGLEIFEIAARKMKLAMVGHGAAQKSAVATMVQRMLRLEELPSPDAADALALALSFAQETGRYSIAPPKKL